MISGLWLMSIDLNVGMEILVANSMLQGMAIGIIWVPLTIASFATLDNRFWPEAMAVFHLLRNIGSSFFISLCVADIVRVTAQNYSRMTEMISPFNNRLTLPWVMGGWNTETLAGLARLSQGDQPPGGDDRLSRRLRDVHRRLGRARCCWSCWCAASAVSHAADHSSITPPRRPLATASARLVASSLANSASRWNFTVCTEMPSARATALLLMP